MPDAEYVINGRRYRLATLADYLAYVDLINPVNLWGQMPVWINGFWYWDIGPAPMVELADASDLKSDAERHPGSSPGGRTK